MLYICITIIVKSIDMVEFLTKLSFAHFLTSWTCFLLFAKKPEGFEQYMVKLCLWYLAPLVLIAFLAIFYVDRKYLRWLKNKWICMAHNYFWDYLIYWDGGKKK